MKTWIDFPARGKSIFIVILMIGIPLSLIVKLYFGSLRDPLAYLMIGFAYGASAMMWLYEKHEAAK